MIRALKHNQMDGYDEFIKIYGALDIAARGYVLAMGSNEFSGTSEEILTNERIGVAYLGAEVSDAGESA